MPTRSGSIKLQCRSQKYQFCLQSAGGFSGRCIQLLWVIFCCARLSLRLCICEPAQFQKGLPHCLSRIFCQSDSFVNTAFIFSIPADNSISTIENSYASIRCAHTRQPVISMLNLSMFIETYILRLLAAVKKYGTLSRVGEELGTTQPSISRGMQKLEGELGVTLFERTKNPQCKINPNRTP